VPDAGVRWQHDIFGHIVFEFWFFGWQFPASFSFNSRF
jgi:hypothetical protein